MGRFVLIQVSGLSDHTRPAGPGLRVGERVNSCSGVIARSTLLVNLYGAVSVKLMLMRSQGNIFVMGTPNVSNRRLR